MLIEFGKEVVLSTAYILLVQHTTSIALEAFEVIIKSVENI